jgi:hypothetical protein
VAPGVLRRTRAAKQCIKEIVGPLTGGGKRRAVNLVAIYDLNRSRSAR